MKRMGWDDQMRDLKTIDPVHVLSGDGWRGGMEWSEERLKQLTKFTYFLETDEEDGIGWSDERSWNNWPSSRTVWWWMMVKWRVFKRLRFTYMLEMDEEDEIIRSLKPIDKVHVLSGDGWRRWDKTIRWWEFKQFHQVRVPTGEDGLRW